MVSHLMVSHLHLVLRESIFVGRIGFNVTLDLGHNDLIDSTLLMSF